MGKHGFIVEAGTPVSEPVARQFSTIGTVNKILNISTYKFIPLADTEALRDLLEARALALNLKGTILLAEEGLNLFLAGPAQDVHDFMCQLRADTRFADIVPKEGQSIEVWGVVVATIVQHPT